MIEASSPRRLVPSTTATHRPRLLDPHIGSGSILPVQMVRVAHSCLDGVLAGYFGESSVRHMAVLCKQYNDFGSVTRDAEEDNLTSVDFAELGTNANGALNHTPASGLPGMTTTESANKRLGNRGIREGTDEAFFGHAAEHHR
jgi:hypothetical protein